MAAATEARTVQPRSTPTPTPTPVGDALAEQCPWAAASVPVTCPPRRCQPEAQTVQPVLDLGEQLCSEVVAPLTSHLLVADQNSSSQHLKVLGDRGATEVESFPAGAVTMMVSGHAAAIPRRCSRGGGFAARGV
jgi:hypothetical protein